jgi:hypothetical protein
VKTVSDPLASDAVDFVAGLQILAEVGTGLPDSLDYKVSGVYAGVRAVEEFRRSGELEDYNREEETEITNTEKQPRQRISYLALSFPP